MSGRGSPVGFNIGDVDALLGQCVRDTKHDAWLVGPIDGDDAAMSKLFRGAGLERAQSLQVHDEFERPLERLKRLADAQLRDPLRRGEN